MRADTVMTVLQPPDAVPGRGTPGVAFAHAARLALYAACPPATTAPAAQQGGVSIPALTQALTAAGWPVTRAQVVRHVAWLVAQGLLEPARWLYLPRRRSYRRGCGGERVQREWTRLFPTLPTPPRTRSGAWRTQVARWQWSVSRVAFSRARARAPA